MASKVALVTGSNSGLGLALTVLLAKDGWTVWAGMRDPDNKGKDLVAEAEKEGVAANVKPLDMDVNDDESVAKAFKTAIPEGGRLDLLVNNAGYALLGTLEMVNMEQCKSQFETNVFGVIRCTTAAVPTMRAQKSGKIVYISSMGGVWGQCFNEVYCASKFAVEGLAESQCAVFREFGVYVTCVEPGGIRTKFTANAKMPDFSAIPAEYQDSFQKTLGFYGIPGMSQSPEECAQEIMNQVVHVEQPPLRVQPNTLIKDVFDKTQLDPSGMASVRLNMTKILGKPEEGCCPPGSLPYLQATYTGKGTVVKQGDLEFYTHKTGSPTSAIIMCPDIWGWNGGRMRAVADHFAATYMVVVPKYLNPVFEGGTDGDAMSPTSDFNMEWIKQFPWSTQKPKMDACIELCKAAGITKIGVFGFCYGGHPASWMSAENPGLITCATVFHPSMQLETFAFGGDMIALMKSVKCPFMIAPTGDDLPMFAEEGDFATALKSSAKGSECVWKVYKDMSHGFTVRGDLADANTKRDVEAVMKEAAEFMAKYL